MTSVCYALVWKNLILRKTNLCQLILTFAVPIIAFALLNKFSGDLKNKPIVKVMELKSFDDEPCQPVKNGTILYEPDNEFVVGIMKKVACYAGYSEEDVKYGSIGNDSLFDFGINFQGLSGSIPDSINYTIYPTDPVWSHLQNLRTSGAKPKLDYLDRGPGSELLVLQSAIDLAFLSSKEVTAKEKVIVSQLPEWDIDHYTWLRVMYILFSENFFHELFMTIPIYIVEEKVTGTKEQMLMMGVKRWQYWGTRVIDVLFWNLINQCLALIFLWVPLSEDSFVFEGTNAVILWWFLAFESLSCTAFFCFVTCLCSNQMAALVSTHGAFWVGLLLVFIPITSLAPWVVRLIKMTLCLLPGYAVGSGFLMLMDSEMSGKPLDTVDAFEEHQIRFEDILIMSGVDLIIYIFATWYFDQVNPGSHGTAQPLCFCFKSSSWKTQPTHGIQSLAGASRQYGDRFEGVPSGLTPGVSVLNLTKKYKSRRKGSLIAVNDLTMDFYKGEITSLLGRNGAGKTTAFAMITGLTSATAGEVFINGYDVARTPALARRSIGFSPQHELLFYFLSTLQTLLFFGMIKGLSKREAITEANELLVKLKLENVKNTLGVLLSGGQKKKLSVGIALIGGSEVLVLDEPTSGMDPETRREIWDILLALRKSKTILLTTHYMEEADVLSDRIAIMDHGVIQCYGTPMYLKSKFAEGYILAVVMTGRSTSSQITSVVRQNLSSAKFISEQGITLYYRLLEKDLPSFPSLLALLEDKKTKGDIGSYSLNIATLDEVFMKVDKLAQRKDETSLDPKSKKHEERSSVSTIACCLMCYQMYALYVKKSIYFIRSVHVYLIFCIFTILVTVFISFSLKQDESDLQFVVPLSFSLALYAPCQVLYTADSSLDTIKLEELVKQMGGVPRLVTDLDSELEKLYKGNNATGGIVGLTFSQPAINISYYKEHVHMPSIAANLIHWLKLKTKETEGQILTSVDNVFVNMTKTFGSRQEGCINPSLEAVVALLSLPHLYYLIAINRENHYFLKHLQLMITTPLVYWFCHITFDIVTLMPFLACEHFLLEYLMPETLDAFRSSEDMYVTLLLWGISLILLAYLLGALLKQLTQALYFGFLIIIIIPYLLYRTLLLNALNEYEGVNIAETTTLPWLAYLHPTLTFKIGVVWTCLGSQADVKHTLVGYILVLFLLLMFNDTKILSLILHRAWPSSCCVNFNVQGPVDEDVTAEEDEVKRVIDYRQLSEKPLVAAGLCRWYRSCCCSVRKAVKNLSFTVNRQECFGLLGVNGAGKSTTINMLTGNLIPTRGQAYVNGYSLMLPWKRPKYLFQIGYCPQFDGILPDFHGRELLALFARLRGVQFGDVKKEVQNWIEKMGLTEFADRRCGTYSGGNLRKLVTGMALIGDCPLIFLDEPTTGIDPIARRIIWKSILELRNRNQSVVLTSHSMEECEALCTRLAVMVEGRFRCIGNTVTLKNKFGQGYSVQLKLSTNANEKVRSNVKIAIMEAFLPGCKLIDEHYTILQYRITNPAISWPRLFHLLEKIKKRFRGDFESYTASSTTLEEIFLSFARGQ